MEEKQQQEIDLTKVYDYALLQEFCKRWHFLT